MKKTNKFFCSIILIAVLFLSKSIAQSQETDDRIVLVFSENPRFLQKIEFYDNAKKLINTYDIEKSNPYNNFSLPLSNSDKYYGTNVYDISNDTSKSKIRKYLKGIDENTMSDVKNLTSSVKHDINGDYAVVTYKTHIMGGEGEGHYSEAQNFSFEVLDSSGKTILKKSDLTGGSGVNHISKNGRYLLLSCGLEKEDRVYGTGIKIIDVKTGDQLFEIKTNGMDGSSNQFGMITFRKQGDAMWNEYYVFDEDIPALFYRDFNPTECSHLRQWDKQGFNIYENGKEIKLYYDKDFTRLW